MLSARLKAQLGLLAASAVFLSSVSIIVFGAMEQPVTGQPLTASVSHVAPAMLGNVAK